MFLQASNDNFHWILKQILMTEKLTKANFTCRFLGEISIRLLSGKTTNNSVPKQQRFLNCCAATSQLLMRHALGCENCFLATVWRASAKEEKHLMARCWRQTFSTVSQHLENDFVMYSPVVLWKRQTVDVDHTGLKIATWIKLMQGFDCLQRDGRIKVGSKRKF